MGNWDKLPYEILDLILFHAGLSFQTRKSMTVNKQWYNYYLSRLFKTVSLRLDSSNLKLDQIATSPFKPGQWTTCIKFITFKAPADLDNIDIAEDYLDLLIRNTPHVQKVKFIWSEKVNVQDWAYFSIILLKNDNWKLRIFPETWNNQLISSAFYYNCAYHVRYTLEKLNLTLGMIAATNFNCLKEFTALTCLDIDKNILKDVYGLDSVLQYIPSLEEIDVDFLNTYCMEQDNNETLGVYPNVKKITFLNFTPQTSNQLSIFTDNFTHLENLHIVGEKSKPWPAVTVEPHVTEIFFKMLNSISEYQITVPGNVIDVDFINKQFTQGVDLSVVFIQNIHNILAEEDGSVTIAKTKLDPDIMLQYRIVDDFTSDRFVGRHILSNLNKNVQQVEISKAVLDSTKDYLNALFEKEYKDLRSIILSDLLFRCYKIPDETVLTRQHIQNLKFYNCKISSEALSLLSTRFKYLEYVYFNTCRFQINSMDSYYIDVSMPSTDIDTLCISDIQEHKYQTRTFRAPQPFAIISITDQYLTRYYMTGEDAIIVETTEAKFEFLRSKSAETQKLAVIYIRVKSIKIFSLKSLARKKDVQINL